MTRSDWIDNEYETFITSRRDGVFERAVVCKRRPSNTSSLAVLDLSMAAAAAAGGKVPGADYSCVQQQLMLQQQKFDTPISDVIHFQDMDVALPMHWESMMRASRRRHGYVNALKLQELDSCKNAMIHRGGGGGRQCCDHSKLDQLRGHVDHAAFSHGSDQKAVLEQQEHCSRVGTCKEQKSSHQAAQQQHDFVVSRRTVTEPFSKMSPVTLARMFEPKYSKFCVNSTDFAPVEVMGLPDSRSSSFRSQSSCSVMWESTGEYRGDCMTSSVDQSSSATSSRDSNGSSQDAYFDNCRLSTDSGQPRRSSQGDTAAPACASYNTTDAAAAAIKTCKRPEAGVLHNAERDESAFGAHDLESERPVACRSWLRSPFKWKVPTFGAKSKTKAAAAESMYHAAKVQELAQRQRRIAGRISDISCIDHAALSKLRTAAARHPCTDCLDAAHDPARRPVAPRHSYSESSSTASSCKALPTGGFSSPAGEFVRRRSESNERASASECAANAQLRRRSVSSTHHGHFDRGICSSRSDNVQQGDVREKDTGSCSKARERWLKCMKLLKPPYGRSATPTKTERPAGAASAPHQLVCKTDQMLLHPGCSTPAPSTRTSTPSSVDNHAMRARPSFDDKLMRPARPSVDAANKPMRSKSMPAAFDRTQAMRPKSVVSAPGLAGCGTLSHSPRIPASNVCENTRSKTTNPLAVQMNRAAATSAAGSSAASSASPRVKSSPKYSCRRSVSPKVRNSPKITNSTPSMNNNSNSQMSELHSAVQGAIAHCKKSQTASAPQHQSQPAACFSSSSS